MMRRTTLAVILSALLIACSPTPDGALDMAYHAPDVGADMKAGVLDMGEQDHGSPPLDMSPESGPDSGEGRVGFPPFEDLPEQEDLPDVLLMRDGTRATSPSQWEQTRRAEVLATLEHYAFGYTPDSLDLSYRAEVIVEESDFLDGEATLRVIRVHAGPEQALPIELLLVTPNNLAAAPPVFLGANFFGNHSTTDDARVPLSQGWIPERGEGVVENRATEASRGTASQRWPFEDVIARGYALATFYHGDIDPDRDDFEDGIHALFAQERGDHDWGTIAAWVWGMRVMIEVLGERAEVDSERIALVGHSRNGKVALWASALSPHVAMVISNMSGCMGAALHRRRQGETLLFLNRLFPHWFAKSLHDFGRHEEKLPFDQHFLIALSAPRPLLVVSGSEDAWADPEGEFLGAKAAEEVYTLLGAGELASAQWPGVDDPILSTLGYAMLPGGHAVGAPSWAVFLDFADAHLDTSSD